MAFNGKFPVAVLLAQCIFIVVFAFFSNYGDDADALDLKNYYRNTSSSEKKQFDRQYPWFEDVNVLLFVGVGCLYAFQKGNGMNGLGLNMFVAATSVQWSLILMGAFDDGNIRIDVNSLLMSEFAAASAVIALGGVFGKVSPLQVFVFTLIEVAVYHFNMHFCETFFRIVDDGETVSLHMFAGIFGCAVAFAVDRKRIVQDNPNECSSNESNVFCLVGTMLLWAFWPSFNSSLLTGDAQYRCMLNTFLALIGSCLTGFATSALLHKDNKFTPSHIQNSTLAGGVAIGTCCSLMIHPYMALLIGSVAGIISVCGYQFLTPFLSRLQLHDPCGINSLHALPGFFGGLTGVIAAYTATQNNHAHSLYEIYPAMAPVFNSTELWIIQVHSPAIVGGLGRSAQFQALYQLFYVMEVILVAIVFGLITGSILRLRVFEPLEEKQMYLDRAMWVEMTADDVKVNFDSTNDSKHPRSVNKMASF